MSVLHPRSELVGVVAQSLLPLCQQQGQSGAFVVGEQDALGPGASGHEELYVVVAGACTFTVDGEDVDAPRGTAVFVGNPAAKRSARATEDGRSTMTS
jgi:quercetin dioxygenase-like cupin family protein